MPRQKRTNSPIKHTSPKKPNSKQGAFKIAGVGELTEKEKKKKKKEKEERSKFNVSANKNKRTYRGIVFDSEVEMKYYRDVVVPAIEKDEIVYCELQKTYILQPPFERDGHKLQSINYVGDFFLKYADGHEELIDIKGYADGVAKLKRKLFLYLFPEIDYKWISYSAIDGGWCEYDYIMKQRSLRKRHREQYKELYDIKKSISERQNADDKVLSKTKTNGDKMTDMEETIDAEESEDMKNE